MFSLYCAQDGSLPKDPYLSGSTRSDSVESQRLNDLAVSLSVLPWKPSTPREHSLDPKIFKIHETEYYQDGTISEIHSTAKKIHLINCTVGVVKFINKKGDIRKNKRLIIMGPGAVIEDMQTTQKHANIKHPNRNTQITTT